MLAVNLNVKICTQNPQNYLILSHILSVAGYKPSLMSLQAPSNLATEAIPYAILFDTSENTEPILEFCAAIKQNSATRDIILVALAQSCNSLNFLDFLQAGFDEFFPHPFVPERVLSFLHDRQTSSLERKTLASDRHCIGHVGELNILSGERILRHGEMEIRLTPTEFRILRGFIAAPGQVMKREQLIKIGWPPHHYVQPRTVDVHVGNLRRQLWKLTGKNLIRTVHTTGYAFELSQ
ncbi:winged helix-turn-helix domain-containing protein [Ochrobactrum sp. Q0168]|uniref:winged helix-turn-helix domain-containing protein n=1 Tax=Ochrobactrum sp. Q0168 TaxID=2793241 RepID=UPI001FFFF04C